MFFALITIINSTQVFFFIFSLMEISFCICIIKHWPFNGSTPAATGYRYYCSLYLKSQCKCLKLLYFCTNIIKLKMKSSMLEFILCFTCLWHCSDTSKTILDGNNATVSVSGSLSTLNNADSWVGHVGANEDWTTVQYLSIVSLWNYINARIKEKADCYPLRLPTTTLPLWDRQSCPGQ